MKEYVVYENPGRTDRFEVVEKIPKGYVVWNIGKHMVAGYLALAEFLHPEDKDDYTININTLKCIPMKQNEIDILQDAAGRGCSCIKDCRKTLARTAKTTYMREKQKRAAAALPILERISA